MSSEQPGTVLIVDDEEGIREVLTLHMEALGLQYIEATDGEEALRMIRTHHVDVIISDISMPNLTGVEFLEILREEGRKVPFIFVTGQASVESTVQALRLGAFDYIEKPFDLDDIEKLVTEAIRVSRQKQDLAQSNWDLGEASEGDTSLQNQLFQIRAVGNAGPSISSPLGDATEDVGIFVAETVPQLLFCGTSIEALSTKESVVHEAGYLFRIMQSVRMAAEVLELHHVAEMAREFEECYMVMRIYGRPLASQEVKLLRDATENLQRYLERIEKGDPELGEDDLTLRTQLSELRLHLEMDGTTESKTG